MREFMRCHILLVTLLLSSSTSLCAAAKKGVVMKTWKGERRIDLAKYGHSAKRGVLEAADAPSGRKMDIVIAHYHVETLHSMLTNWTRFLDTDKVKTIRPTVFVYSLNSEIDLSVYKPIVGENGHAVRMPNIGREGGVYLAHILAYWDNLADHTLFSQAVADPLLDYRFQALFGPKTGILALALYAHQDCAIDDGWLPVGQLVQLFSIFTRKFCSPEGYSSMYNGQFVVSKKRIRAQPREVYEHVEGLLAAPIFHWVHTIHKNAHYKHESNPFFGHSMERAWSLAFDCYEMWRYEACNNCDNRMWSDCHPEACQCLDQ